MRHQGRDAQRAGWKRRRTRFLARSFERSFFARHPIRPPPAWLLLLLTSLASSCSHAPTLLLPLPPSAALHHLQAWCNFRCCPGPEQAPAAPHDRLPILLRAQRHLVLPPTAFPTFPCCTWSIAPTIFPAIAGTMQARTQREAIKQERARCCVEPVSRVGCILPAQKIARGQTKARAAGKPSLTVGTLRMQQSSPPAFVWSPRLLLSHLNAQRHAAEPKLLADLPSNEACGGDGEGCAAAHPYHKCGRPCLNL